MYFPALHDRHGVGNLAVAATELSHNRAISALLGGDAVDVVGAQRIRLDISVASELSVAARTSLFRKGLLHRRFDQK